MLKQFGNINDMWEIVSLFLKIGPYGPELVWHFGTSLAKNTHLVLVASKHMKLRSLREVKST